MNLSYIDSNSCGHCRMVLSITGLVKYFGLMLHAYHPYKVHIYRKFSLPINYWIQPCNPFPLSLRVEGLQRFVFLIIWWTMKIYDTHEFVWDVHAALVQNALKAAFWKNHFTVIIGSCSDESVKERHLSLVWILFIMISVEISTYLSFAVV